MVKYKNSIRNIFTFQCCPKDTQDFVNLYLSPRNALDRLLPDTIGSTYHLPFLQ